ncbi:transposase family protein [Coraliomargarita sp. W4R53]
MESNGGDVTRTLTDKRRKVKLYDHVKPRSWHHLNVFNYECLIECSLPQFKCQHCEKVWRVKAPLGR